MPRVVADSLKAKGEWRPEGGDASASPRSSSPRGDSAMDMRTTNPAGEGATRPRSSSPKGDSAPSIL